jgi:hypothetical protein
MAESVQQKCLNCKKMGMIRCDGCNQRFCSTHFNDHRHHLDTLFERICNDRDSLCEQINNPRTASPSTHPQLIPILNEINEWESKTLNMVQKTADRARQQVNELMNSNNTTAEIELDKLSKELRRRKEDDDYFEQNIEQLSKKLEQIQMSLNKNAPPVHINITSIDWSTVIQVSTEKFEKPKRQIIKAQSNQLFIGGTLLSIYHQIQLNRFYGNENQKWQLVYKVTKHGFSASICHQCCDNQGPTLTIIQSSEGYLFGGYTAIEWNSENEWMVDKTAFLFTLINPHNIPPTKYTIKSTGENAILSGFGTGPTFGMWDICIYLECGKTSSSNSNFPSNYIDSTKKGNLTFTGSNIFELTDLEIYRLA